jgi:uncharacterized membrane protein
VKPEVPEVTPSQIAASLIFVIVGTFIWVPIGFLMASVNLKLTLVIFLMAFVMQSCKMYLGIK